MDAGPAVRWALPMVRVVHDVAASIAVATLLLAATMIPGRTRPAAAMPDEPRRAAALRIVTGAAFVWAVAGVIGVVFRGSRYDTGDRLDYLKAVVRLGTRHSEFGSDFRSWLQSWVDTDEGKGRDRAERGA